MLIGPPATASALLVVWGLPAVVATGLCPGAPPDIPASACTPAEYLLRMTFGTWALMGHMTLWAGWSVIATLSWMVLLLFRGTKRT